MDYQELLQKYIVERQASEQKLIGGEVIELTLFASWLNKNASQQSFAPDWLPLTPEQVDEDLDALQNFMSGE